MKKILIPLFLLVLLFSILFSFSAYRVIDKTVCIETDTQQRADIIYFVSKFYLLNKNKPVTGKNLCAYDNGQKESEGSQIDGKKDGKWTTWHENGQIKRETTYIDGKKTGKQTTWYENGQKESEENVNDGKQTTWHENGQKESEGNQIDGKKDGKWTTWHENSKKKMEAIYKDGQCVSGDC